MKGFREFLTRGSLVELAVTVVIGTAFTAGKAAAHMSLGSGRGLAVPSPDARGKG